VGPKFQELCDLRVVADIFETPTVVKTQFCIGDRVENLGLVVDLLDPLAVGNGFIGLDFFDELFDDILCFVSLERAVLEYPQHTSTHRRQKVSSCLGLSPPHS
jgi:hypothetical protein